MFLVKGPFPLTLFPLLSHLNPTLSTLSPSCLKPSNELPSSPNCNRYFFTHDSSSGSWISFALPWVATYVMRVLIRRSTCIHWFWLFCATDHAPLPLTFARMFNLARSIELYQLYWDDAFSCADVIVPFSIPRGAKQAKQEQKQVSNTVICRGSSKSVFSRFYKYSWQSSSLYHKGLSQQRHFWEPSI